MTRWNLATEALAVGVALALALALLVSRGVRITSFKTALAVGLVVGAALHVLFELSGLNGAYCRMGHACAA
jgi:uncharacterized membrane protein (DUF441 family)